MKLKGRIPRKLTQVKLMGSRSMSLVVGLIDHMEEVLRSLAE